MTLDLNSLERAISSLERSINVYNTIPNKSADVLETIRAGVIQNFEVAYEQCWKMMKRWLEQNIGSVYVDGVTRRELFRIAAENQLITNIEEWMEYHNSRNLTSHTYDDEAAEDVFAVSKKFFKSAESFLKRLNAKK